MSSRFVQSLRAACAGFLNFFRSPEERIGVAMIAATILIFSAHYALSDPSDQTAIQTTLHGMFDKPGVELVIDPIAVEGEFAVAGWTQGDMGGRAFLKKSGSGWTLVLCTGDEIRSAEALAASGVPADAAQRLAGQIAQVEKTIGPARLQKLASFQGVVRMDGQSQ